MSTLVFRGDYLLFPLPIIGIVSHFFIGWLQYLDPSDNRNPGLCV